MKIIIDYFFMRRTKTVGADIMQVSFHTLIHEIDFQYIFSKDGFTTPTLIKDAIEFGLDVPIQGRLVSTRLGRYPLSIENYFRIHRWEPTNTGFIY